MLLTHQPTRLVPMPCCSGPAVDLSQLQTSERDTLPPFPQHAFSRSHGGTNNLPRFTEELWSSLLSTGSEQLTQTLVAEITDIMLRLLALDEQLQRTCICGLLRSGVHGAGNSCISCIHGWAELMPALAGWVAAAAAGLL